MDSVLNPDCIRESLFIQAAGGLGAKPVFPIRKMPQRGHSSLLAMTVRPSRLCDSFGYDSFENYRLTILDEISLAAWQHCEKRAAPNPFRAPLSFPGRHGR
jgi:hypothetical protein